MELLSRKKFSDETMKKVHWVRRMYVDWCNFRNSQDDLQSYECDIENVNSITKENLSHALCRFITEVKKLDGSDCPSRTMYDIVICMQFWLETQGLTWKLLNDHNFQQVRFTLDNIMKEHTANRVGGKVRKAEVLNFSEEDLFWSLGLLGYHNPEALLHSVVFTLGLNCSLRAGKEHRSLRSIPFNSQFEFKTDSQGVKFIRYMEDFGLKTNKGGIKQHHVDVKTVDVYPNGLPDRCPVKIITTYMSRLPQNRKCQAFYLQAKKNYKQGQWYLDRPVGANTLREVVSNVCEKAAFPGYFTNHSLRSTSATHMYHCGIDEQIIQEITGHRSQAVRSYKRTSDEQKCYASQIVSGGIKW